MPEYQIVVSGNYLLQVQHGTDMVEFTFRYDAAWLVAVSPFAYLNDTIEIAKLYANTDLDIKRSVAICPLCNMAYEAVRNRVKKNR